MSHPTLKDKLLLRLNPHYLYSNQLCQNTTSITIGIIHKVSSNPPQWKTMDFVKLSKGSTLKYLGGVKELRFKGDLNPSHSIFDLIASDTSVFDEPTHHANPGDLVIVIPQDRRFLVAKPS